MIVVFDLDFMPLQIEFCEGQVWGQVRIKKELDRSTSRDALAKNFYYDFDSYDVHNV
jgi:hypothetical protein